MLGKTIPFMQFTMKKKSKKFTRKKKINSALGRLLTLSEAVSFVESRRKFLCEQFQKEPSYTLFS